MPHVTQGVAIIEGMRKDIYTKQTEHFSTIPHLIHSK
jgi:hypothetical protein